MRQKTRRPVTQIKEIELDWDDVAELAIKNQNRSAGSDTAHSLKINPPFEASETPEATVIRTDGRYPSDVTAPITINPFEVLDAVAAGRPRTYGELRAELRSELDREPTDEELDEAYEIGKEVWIADAREHRRDTLEIPVRDDVHSIQINWE